MRKKRPSYSPVKTANLETPDAPGCSSNPSASQKPADFPSTDNNSLDTGLASLQFEELSWDDGNGGYKRVGTADLLKLFYYVKTLFPEVVSIHKHVSYLIIWCKESVPESSKRPFSYRRLAGCLAC